MIFTQVEYEARFVQYLQSDYDILTCLNSVPNEPIWTQEKLDQEKRNICNNVQALQVFETKLIEAACMRVSNYYKDVYLQTAPKNYKKCLEGQIQVNKKLKHAEASLKENIKTFKEPCIKITKLGCKLYIELVVSKHLINTEEAKAAAEAKSVAIKKINKSIHRTGLFLISQIFVTALGAGLGFLLGTMVFPGIGSVSGATAGAALFSLGNASFLGMGGLGLVNAHSFAEGVFYSLIITLGTTGLGAALGVLVGTFLFPGVGTVTGLLIGGGLGFAVATLIEISAMVLSTIDLSSKAFADVEVIPPVPVLPFSLESNKESPLSIVFTGNCVAIRAKQNRKGQDLPTKQME